MSEHFEYRPKGVCSTKMIFELDGDKVESLRVEHGCDGNLKAVSALVKGRTIDEVIDTLEGITCRMKATSCPDQIARALKQYQEEKNS